MSLVMSGSKLYQMIFRYMLCYKRFTHYNFAPVYHILIVLSIKVYTGNYELFYTSCTFCSQLEKLTQMKFSHIRGHSKQQIFQCHKISILLNDWINYLLKTFIKVTEILDHMRKYLEPYFQEDFNFIKVMGILDHMHKSLEPYLQEDFNLT